MMGAAPYVPRASAGPGVYEVAAAVIFGLLYSYVVFYLFTLGYAAFQPNYYYALTYLAGAFAYLTHRGARESLPQHAALVSIWLVLILLMAAQVLFLEITSAGTSLFIGRVHFLATLVATFFLLGACARLDLVIFAVGAIALASCAINVAEFFFAGTAFDWLSTVPGRAAGFYGNSNDSAMFIALAVPIVAVNVSLRPRWIFYALTFVGVYVTFSRGGLVVWASLVATSELMLGYGRRGWGTRVFLTLISLLGVAGLLSFFSADAARTLTETLWPYLDANTIARVEFASNDSTAERMLLIERGLEAFAEAPLLGQGVGYTHAWDASASVHNMMILLLAEQGLLGGIWFLGLLALLWSYGRPYGVAIAIAIFVSGLFSHNHFERPTLALVVALYLVAAVRRQRPSR
jgi:O-Antigen ligase